MKKRFLTMVKKHKKPLIWSFVVIILFFGGIIFFELSYLHKYYPGILIQGQKVGGKTYDQVLELFTVKSEELSKNGITIVFNGHKDKKELHIPSSVDGLSQDSSIQYFSIEDIVPEITKAYEFGRRGSIFQKIAEHSRLLFGKTFTLPVFAHREALASFISRETKNIFIAAKPAEFSFSVDGKIMIIPEIPGENMDIEKATNEAVQNISSLKIEPIIFTVESETPYTTEERLKPLLVLAEKMVTSTSLNFFYSSRSWVVRKNILVTWFSLNPDNQITIDSKKLEAFLAKSIVPLINNPPENSRFNIDNGVLIETSPGSPGYVVNTEKTKNLIETALLNKQQYFIDTNIDELQKTVINIPIETIKVEPAVTQKTINQYNIKDLIGHATTNFTGGSLDRQRNIEVGTSKITGILIAPGQEFSTVEAIGYITEEAGFVKEYVINGNQTVKELGGGLCQLATTLFRLALNAGLPVTERVNHKYVIPYYGPGLDATVYGPHPDFRFVNDTDNYILIQGTTKKNELILELYGVSDGRVAAISEPVLSNEKPVPPTRNIYTNDLVVGQVQCATATHKGITADVDYTVTYKNGTVKNQKFHSVYQPWPKVCLIGTRTP